MLLGMLSLLQMTTNSLLDTLLQELFTSSFVYANAPLSPERPKSKRSNNFIYWDLVRDLKILNERHYEQCLKDSEELRECEVYLNPAHLEGLKKFLARNFLIGYCAFVRLVIIEISGRNSLGAVSLLLGTVAIKNRMSITAFTKVLFWWYWKLNQKTLWLILFNFTSFIIKMISIHKYSIVYQKNDICSLLPCKINDFS